MSEFIEKPSVLFLIVLVGVLAGLALAFVLWQVFSALRPKPSAINEILRT